MKIMYKNKEYTQSFNVGRCWREPSNGIKMSDCGEYDLTEYVEDEVWVIEDNNQNILTVYKSECKVANHE